MQAARRRGGALLISNPANVRYMTGFTGSAGFLVVTGGEAVFITDPRYGADALGPQAGRVYETVVFKDAPEKAVSRVCRRLGVQRLAFEKSVSYVFYEKLRGAFGAKLTPVSGVVEGFRQAKDGFEMACIREAVRHAEGAFREVEGWLRPGVSEEAFAARLERAILRRGLKASFPAIVASGPNSAVPHARPTGRRFSSGDLIVVDWGAIYEGYCSDMTRTFLIKGQKNGQGKDLRLAEKRRIYRTVLEAQDAAIRFVRMEYGEADGKGKGPKDIDNSARYVIKQAGYGEYFGHSLGHGVGLEVHEQPSISPRRAGKGGGRPLIPKTVFTVEPGIYVPGLGGVRIEDMVYLAEPRPEVLTHLPKAGI